MSDESWKTPFLRTILIVLIGLSVGIVATIVGRQAIAETANKETEEVRTTSEFDIIVLDSEEYHKNRKGPVEFSHKKHSKDYEISCWDCHHVYENGKNIYSPWDTTDKCISCHSPLIEQEKAMKLQASFHLNCKLCHEKEDIYKGELRAYKKCIKCHEKKPKQT